MSISAVTSNGFGCANQSVQNASQTYSQQFGQLAEDLRSGNLSAAQQDASNIQQGAQNTTTHTHGHHHHHGHGAAQTDPSNQLFQELGQDPLSTSPSNSQQVYVTLAQSYQQAALDSQTLVNQANSNLSVTA